MSRHMLPYEVNCQSCDHLLFLTNRKGEFFGHACESDMEHLELTELMPFDWMTCHSLYELYEQHEEGLAAERREDF